MLQELAFVDTLSKRIIHIRTQLDGHLHSLLGAALGQRHMSAAGHCLHAYVELNDAVQGESAIRSMLVGPIIKTAVATFKTQHLKQGTCGVSVV